MNTNLERSKEAESYYQAGLARLTNNGTAPPPDDTFDLFVKAATLDDSISMEIFGTVCHRKVSQKESVLMAIKWNQFAARQGCRMSMVKLGKIYENGDGVAMNKVRAYICFGAAHRFGVDWALFAQERVSRTMTWGQLSEARNKLMAMKFNHRPWDF